MKALISRMLVVCAASLSLFAVSANAATVVMSKDIPTKNGAFINKWVATDSSGTYLHIVLHKNGKLYNLPGSRKLP